MRYIVTAIGSMSAKSVIDSLRQNDETAEIIGLDIHPKEWVALSDQVDFFYQAPLSNHPDYINFLLEIAGSDAETMIIPLTDPEVDIISDNLEHFANKQIVCTVAPGRIVEKCRNKLLWSEALSSKPGVEVIQTVTYDKLDELPNAPVLAKPANGRSSEGLLKFNAPREVPSYLHKDYIYQPYLSGSIYTADVLKSQNSEIVIIPRKELIRTSNGAGIAVKVEREENIIKLSGEIAGILDISGCMNFEFIQHNNQYYLMDINPRFSAGIEFSRLAGYDFVWNTIRHFQGCEIQSPGSNFKELTAVKQYFETITSI